MVHDAFRDVSRDYYEGTEKYLQSVGLSCVSFLLCWNWGCKHLHVVAFERKEHLNHARFGIGVLLKYSYDLH